MIERLNEQRLLNEFQRHLPLCSTPFSHMAKQLGTDVDDMLAALDRLQKEGTISRVGPVFTPNTVGASTLAAMAVPVDDLDRVAAIVGAYSQVNHNYEREHAHNLWFVVSDKNPEALKSILSEMERRCGYPILTLPLVKAYHIDLGFDLESGEQTTQCSSPRHASGERTAFNGSRPDLSLAAQQLVAATQSGLPLVERPYQHIADQLGCSEVQVIAHLQDMLDHKIIKRMGVIVRHRKLGYRANAMVVWEVPEHQVDDIGLLLSRHARVNLCYQRPRQPPDWHYNLFCMIHGKHRDEVVECVEHITEQHQLHHVPRDILFSNRCFKQRGATYAYG